MSFSMTIQPYRDGRIPLSYCYCVLLLCVSVPYLLALALAGLSGRRQEPYLLLGRHLYLPS